MSLEHNAQSAANHSFPRVSGDEPDLEEMIIPSHEFSPRERG